MSNRFLCWPCSTIVTLYGNNNRKLWNFSSLFISQECDQKSTKAILQTFKEELNMETLQTECKRCGTCCMKGGPALHSQDLGLVLEGHLPIDMLITIRKGELAHNPRTGKLQPVKAELIKIRGTGKEWSCIYFEKDLKGCSIYAHRPFACRTLECWNTEELLELVGKDILTRIDILKEGDPLQVMVEEHERHFPCPDLEKLADVLVSGSCDGQEGLQQLVSEELLFRNKVVKENNLSLYQELFYFGRPLFQLLQPLGIEITETVDGISLKWPSLG